ncbi:24177_t:CDS:1, partial [Cetraspora pellucida]
MSLFSNDDIEVETWLNSNVQSFILVIYDKYIFLAYNESQSLWISEEEQPLRKKDKGYSIHISEFLTNVY